MNKLDKLSKFAPFLVRVGVGVVFIWFGWSALSNTEMWVRLVPAWTGSIMGPMALVKIHGLVEFVFGILVVLGVYTRISAGILFLSLLHTLFLINGPTLARDTAIAFAVLSVAIYKRPSSRFLD